MKKILLIVGLILTQQALSQIPTNGLSVHYEFDGDCNDASANNYHGAAINGVYVDDRNGNANSAIRFGSTSTEVVEHNFFSHTSDFVSQSYSVGIWLKNISFESQYPRIMEVGPLNTSFFRLWEDLDAIQSGFFNTNSEYRTMSAWGFDVSLSDWNHYAITSDFNSTTETRVVKFYINGQLYETVNYGAGESNINYSTTFPYLSIGLSLNADLDDFIYYSRALSPAEVLTVYGECFTAEQINTVTIDENTLTIEGITSADYQWVDCDDSNAPISGATSQSFTPTVSGNYAVEISSDACTELSDCNFICILDLTVNISGNTLSAVQSGATTYQWVDCNNANAPVSSETASTFTPTISGSYAVVLTSGSCTETSACQAVTISTSGIEEQTTNNLNIYPNPASDLVTLNNLSIGSTLRLIDITGKIVLETIVSEEELHLELSQVNSGIYYFELMNNQEIIGFKKLIVNK